MAIVGGLLSPFVGGAFGSGLRPQYNVVLAALASRARQRSVRLVLTRPPDMPHLVATGAAQREGFERGQLTVRPHRIVVGDCDRGEVTGM